MAGTYFDLLKRLYPRGPYDMGEGTINAADTEAIAARLGELEAQIDALGKEIFADTTEALLASFERVYGLPSNSGEAPTVRRQALLSKLRRSPGISISAIQDALEPLVGYRPTVTEYVLQTGDPPEYIFKFTVNIQWAQVTKTVRISQIRQAIEDAKPAHTQGLLTFDNGFLFDDAGSLTDTPGEVLSI
jgi:uncharacterized protein YmfQ (DUF2313 family)